MAQPAQELEKMPSPDHHIEDSATGGAGQQQTPPIASDLEQGRGEAQSKLMRFYAHPWTQIMLISVICFCLPGMYNALTGIGGSGQVDPTVAANATVALLATTAATSLLIVGPVFTLTGPRVCFLLGGWAYALYSGSLLHFNHSANGAFVIAAGAVLGVGAALLWIVQGAIMTTYVDESQKGRAIAVFWVVFNFGGGIGSLVSFGLNYHSAAGTVGDSTYIALMVIMIFGWCLGFLICSPKHIRLAQLHAAVEKEKTTIAGMFRMTLDTLMRWRVACMIPLFFSANVFYSYQQNNVNGFTFNLRTRSLNGALYWFSQMAGGLLIGLLLDLPMLSRPARARLGWAFVFVTGMVIWGGGYQFQLWQDGFFAAGGKQTLDFKDSKTAVGPMFLYIFYGCYDALWQGFAYWLIGTESNSTSRAAVLVGLYKGLQAAGAAMAWRLNALQLAPMKQLAMDWGLCIGSLIVVLPMVLTISEKTVAEGEGGAAAAEQRQEEKLAEE
ncbi:Major facilitator superfamily domain, general substrate transporter [Cordyceps fumosorosea ARSEF 2679]|uniref:Major facilitator superfamily domain, general substrate transporter n=1 Tax=Cordyceps fumosorosea (strain ARSEF 2679) TaxID=1081104 RepID=A0A167QLV3_CORFA|nr:Major facilitator superfamily domain, general substrate transporter [Cordyceps fumosorosea ARSEF 2679]OAA57758.1 Major facilitator superfamily domain, general substrate transporter [Cordyceps fumosorosea ARSEF 2679]